MYSELENNAITVLLNCTVTAHVVSLNESSCRQWRRNYPASVNSICLTVW